MTTDFEKASTALQKAVRDYVGGFQAVPSDWARLAAEHKDKEDFLPMPMWGTVFLVSGMDRGAIEKLLTSPVPADAPGLIEFAEEHGIEIEESEMKLLAIAALEHPDDLVSDEITAWLADLRRLVQSSWQDSDSEAAMLSACGWQDVGSTGLIAREIDDELVIGINGAGYNFYEAHWMPLYLAVGYRWHITSEPDFVAKPKRKRAKKAG